MSSESVGQRSARSFRLAVIISLACLLVGAVVLSVLNTTRGPRLRSAELDVAATVTQPGEQLVLVTDQRLRPVVAADLTITPAAGARVSAEGTTLFVSFEEALRYDTSYAVSIRVTSQATGAAGTLGFEFTTPGGRLFALQRAGAGAAPDVEDRIVRRLLPTGDQVPQDEVVHRAPRIQQYAVADPALAVVTTGDKDSAELTIARLDGSAAPHTVVRESSIGQLKSSGPGGAFGWIVTGYRRSVPPNRLLLFDPAAAAPPKPVVGLDGKPLIVNSWYFVPGTRSIVVQNADSSIYLMDPLGDGKITPLGSHFYVHGFAPGTTSLLVDDLGRASVIDLNTGKRTRPPASNIRDQSQVYQLLPLTSRSQLRLIGRPTDDAPQFRIDVTAGNRTIRIHEPANPTSRIETVCVSPNSQYVAVETSPESAVSDNYSGVTGFSPTTIELVDLATRRVAGTMPGFLVDWCR